MSGEFESILHKSADEVTEPKLYPVGTWLLRCTGVSAKQDEEGRDVFNFAFEGVSPQEDVNEDELAEAGEDIEGQKIFVRRTVGTKPEQFQLKQFFGMLGLDTQGKTFAELVKEAKGTEVLAYVGTRSYTPSGSETPVTVNTAKSFAPADSLMAA